MMGRCLLGLTLAGIGVAAWGQVSVNHPQVQLVQPDGDLNPIVTWMPMAARLDYRLQFTNNTGAELNYLNGRVRLYDSDDQLTQTLNLKAQKFSERARFGDSTLVNGRVLADLPGVKGDTLNHLITTVDGRTWLLGTARHEDGLSRVALGRFLPDGRWDEAFAGDGYVATELKGAARGMGFGGGNRMYVYGGTVGEISRPFVARFNLGGTLSLNYGAGTGVAAWSVGGFGLAEDIAMDGDMAVVAGWRNAGGKRGGFVSRRMVTGAGDPIFAGDGIAYLDIPGTTESRLFGAALDSFRQPVAVGSVLVQGVSRILVVRLTGSGELDLKFGEGGVVMLTFSGWGACSASQVRVLSSGKILVTGRATSLQGNDHFALV
jgi:hypothetical protein